MLTAGKETMLSLLINASSHGADTVALRFPNPF